jgi:hypothetical protein
MPARTKVAEANATAEITTVANDFGMSRFVLMARSFALMATMLAAMT